MSIFVCDLVVQPSRRCWWMDMTTMVYALDQVPWETAHMTSTSFLDVSLLSFHASFSKCSDQIKRLHRCEQNIKINIFEKWALTRIETELFAHHALNKLTFLFYIFGTDIANMISFDFEISTAHTLHTPYKCRFFSFSSSYSLLFLWFRTFCNQMASIMWLISIYLECSYIMMKPLDGRRV